MDGLSNRPTDRQTERKPWTDRQTDQQREIYRWIGRQSVPQRELNRWKDKQTGRATDRPIDIGYIDGFTNALRVGYDP